MPDTLTPAELDGLEAFVALVAHRRERGSRSAPRSGGIAIYSTDDELEAAVSDLVDAAPALIAMARRTAEAEQRIHAAWNDGFYNAYDGNDHVMVQGAWERSHTKIGLEAK